LIDIFLKEYVGSFDIKSNDIITTRNGVIILILIIFEKFDSSKIKGSNIKQPPAGDGTP
jgi:hypothetical protein